MSAHANTAELMAAPNADGAALMAAQLGAPAGAFAPSECVALWRGARVADAASLRRALAEYRDQALVSQELPVICSAFDLARRSAARDLIALDRRLARAAVPPPFAEASRHAGRRQLSRLRPLRGQRLVARYLAAVEAGQARGWHTVVYGLTLALFSIPLRQGLAHYAHGTLRGFAEAQAGPLRLSKIAVEEIARDVCAPIPPAVERLVEFAPACVA